MKKFLAMLLVVLMALALVACQPKPTEPDQPAQSAEPAQSDEPVQTDEPVEPTATPEPVVRPEAFEGLDDEEVYEKVLGKYNELLQASKALENTIDQRFMMQAQAEAYLLNSGVMIPTTTQGGAYAITRIAYRTVPYVQWGNDDDRFFGLAISGDKEFLTKEEREEMKALWEKAAAGEGTYDPIAYLEGKGHTINRDYTLTFSTAPATLDWLNTSMQSDTEITVNTVDGLVQYDNLGNMNPALAESWDISDDGLTYTFHIRKGVKWYTSEGKEYAELTAKDFESGFHHMLDTDCGLDWLVEGVIVGVSEYLDGGSYDDVGYKAIDDYTLEVTLCNPTSYFMTMLTYSIFLPICDSFYQAHGGVFGKDAYQEAIAGNAYTFGKADDVASQVYCGPFLVRKLQSASEILLVKNENYYNVDKVNLNSIKWVYDDGSNLPALYEDACNNVYPGISLSSSLLDLAKADGNFDKYSYISDTTSTTYFGGLALNRRTFALENGGCPSLKDDNQKIDTQLAMLNQNFRLALQYAFDKETFNAVRRGNDLALTCLRNMYTHPEFVKLENDCTDADGHTFPAGTFYGEMVQYYVEQLGMPIDVHDGVNGWYRPDAAKAALEQAKAELGDAVNWPVHIEVVYYSGNETITNESQAYKSVIEACLGSENVVVDLIEATTIEDYYAAGYRAPDGEHADYDMFFGSGWGPDYGDPSTYLDTFLGNGAGYMTKVIALF